MKLTDTLDEQQILEDLIEASKPPMPVECRNSIIFCRRRSAIARTRMVRVSGVPIRWRACTTRPKPSRPPSRRWRSTACCSSPNRPDALAREPAEYTAFSARFAVDRAIDLTAMPYAEQAEIWGLPTEYGPCQTLADAARADGVAAIRYASVRDPGRGTNLALLTCKAFAKNRIVDRQTWRIHPGSAGIRAIREFPPLRLAFAQETFDDPRLAGMVWER